MRSTLIRRIWLAKGSICNMEPLMDYIRHHSKCYKGTTEMRMHEHMHFMQMHESDDAMYRLVQM